MWGVAGCRAAPTFHPTPLHPTTMTFHPIRSTLPAALVAAAAALLHPSVSAQAGNGADASATSWGLGLALVPERRPYRQFDNKTQVWPLLSVENRWLRVAGPGIELKLGQAGPLAFGLTARYARDGYEAADSPALAGMVERKSSVWLGARASWRGALGTLSADWSGDAAGHSNGQKLRLGAEHPFALGTVLVTPRLTATWHDRRFVQYYFGVDAAEVRAGRAAYSPGASVDTEIGLRLEHSPLPHQVVFADLGVTVLGSNVRHSPLVDRSTVPGLRLGWLYMF